MTSEAETPSCVLSSIMQKHSSLLIFEIQRWADLVVNGTAHVNTPPRQLQDSVLSPQRKRLGRPRSEGKAAADDRRQRCTINRCWAAWTTAFVI